MSFILSPFRIAACGRVCASSSIGTRAFSTARPSQLARLTLVGRLGTDPEITTTSSGNEVIKYVVGTSYGPRENRQTSWFRVASFAEKQSPIREKIMGLSKGTLVYLEGDATMRSYEDSEGRKQSQLSLVQTKVEVLKRPSPVASEAAGQA
ncbi:hypothetical protein GJ744_000155 [Endocarpon pusillum]|uniref:SsDNA binding protein n=1 Tax=Endocarpon pusillum TaxID=364733 RepID=A0A8H7B088_9EURO|nr:hypothetical protein GJ744_000155 [Endocarpon pusillum]